MTVISIIFTVLRLLVALPSEIATLKQILALLPSFKGASFKEVVALIIEILKLIIGLVPSNPLAAKGYLGELRDQMASKPVAFGASNGLELLRDKIKGSCDGVGCPTPIQEP